MLYEINYIITSNLPENSALTLTDHTLVFDLHLTDPKNISALFRTASGLYLSTSFFLFLNEPEDADDKWVNEIISFFFFPNYKKQGSAPIILLYSEDCRKTDKIIAILTHCTNAQGFPRLEILNYNFRNETRINIFNSTDPPKIRLAYRELLNSSTTVADDLFIHVSSIEDISMIDQLLQKEENEFINQNPGLVELQKQNKTLREHLFKSKLQNEAMEQEIQILSLHIDLLRSASQAAHLQNYYNNEYEILPHWYKKLGQIIKVFTGKRTFKSLFRKTQKKYKD